MKKLFLMLLLFVSLSPAQLMNWTYVQSWNVNPATYDLTNNSGYVWFYDYFASGGAYNLHNTQTQMISIVGRAHTLGKKFYASAQNNNDGGMNYYANIVNQSDAVMRAGIHSMMVQHRAIHYDGLGLDLEGGNLSGTQALWDNFFQALSDSLHSNGEVLFAYTVQSFRAPWNSPTAIKAFDYILPNGYDFNYTVSWNGEHYGLVGMSCLRDPGNCGITNLHENDSTTIMSFIAGGYKPSQVGLGMSVYGRAWTMYSVNANFCDPMLALQSNYVLYNEIVNSRLASPGIGIKWNPQSATTMIIKTDTVGLKGGSPWICEYPDYNYFKQRITFAKKMGLALVYNYSGDWAELTTVPAGHRKYEMLEMIHGIVGDSVVIVPPPPPVVTNPCDTAYQRGFKDGKASIVIPVCPTPFDTIAWMNNNRQALYDAGWNAYKAQVPDSVDVPAQTITIPPFKVKQVKP